MDVVKLKQLWKDVFGDSQEYIDAFFSMFYSKENTLVYKAKGQVVAALYMVPFDISIEHKSYTAVYLYALATIKEYRSKGIMAGLIQSAHEIGKKRGYIFSILIPADKSLYQYYERFGYNVRYYENRLLINKADIKNICLKEKVNSNAFVIRRLDNITFPRLYETNNPYCENRIKHSKLMNVFFIDSLEMEGGGGITFEFEHCDKPLYALLSRIDNIVDENSKLLIYETNAMTDNEIMMLLFAIYQTYQFEELELMGVFCNRETKKMIKQSYFIDYIYKKDYAAIKTFSDMKIQWNQVYINRLME